MGNDLPKVIQMASDKNGILTQMCTVYRVDILLLDDTWRAEEESTLDRKPEDLG